VRREDDPDDPVGTTRERLLDGVGDPRLPVLHPHEHG
jgi:hypothetical protein